MIEMNLLAKRKQIHGLSELVVARREGWGGGMIREFGTDVYTVLYLKWMANGDLLYSTGNSAQYYVAA